jgi:hypothetical protein
MSRPNNNFKSKVDTYLSGFDHDRFLSVCKQKRAARSAIAREATRWYLDNLQKARESKNESELAMNIKNLTDRICGMLARQGAQTGTMFELTWQNYVENRIEERFIAATNKVKQRMRKRLEEDERILADRMKKVISE